MHVNMTVEFNIFSSILLAFHLANCQPNTLNITWTTLDNHCRTVNDSLVRLNNSNDIGSSTELLLRLSVNGNYTPWIAYLGCFDINVIPQDQIPHQHTISLRNTLEGCYQECQNENISCGKYEPMYFVLQNTLCFCLCRNHDFFSRSHKCNESCYSNVECRADKYRLYREYTVKDKKSDEFCLLCSKVDTNSDANLSTFPCDGKPFGLCVELEEHCYDIKEDSGSNYSAIDCAQQLPFACLKSNEIIGNNQTSGVALTTMEQSSEDFTTASVVNSFDETPTTPFMSSDLSSKYPYYVSSSIPPLNSVTSSDKATTSSTDTVGVIVGLFVAVFALTSLVLLLRFYRKKRRHKLRGSQIDLHQPHSSQTVNNTYSDMMLAPGTNRNQNGVALTTNVFHNADIYMDNEDGEYDHLHTSRPKQVVSEMEDERYATSTQLEDVSYSTVQKCRNSVPDIDNDYDSKAASLDNSCPPVANPNYEFCQHSN